MSDVIVSTTESTTDVTTTNDVTTVAITDTTVEVSQATAGFQGVPGSNSDPTYVFVRNSTGALLPKGSIVYVSGANGVHTQVSLALATGDVTSARTLGWLAEDIANNASGLCCVEGYLDGVNTQGITEGAQLYLSPTVAGGFTQTKPSAPDHMVYVGIAAKASAGNGRVFVHIQNGAELEELHDVKIVSPQNNDLLRYVSGTALWENVASTAITAGSAITAGTAYFASLSGTATTISGSITKSQVSDFTSGTVTSASTAQQAGTAFFASTASTADYATTSGTSVYSANSGTAVTITGSITKSQVSDFTSGTVASASTALTAGTASFASQAGTAVYSDTSGTAVTISGSITRSQVTDYASGTVANISGTVTQAQVSGLGSALAGKAGLADNNTFTGTNTFSNFTTFQAASDAIPIRIFGANGQSADLFSVNDYLTNTQFEILSDGRAQSLKGIIATVSGTASIPLVVRGTAGQSANLTEWTNPAGSTVIARVDKNGAVSANYFGPSGSGLLGYLDWTTNSPIFNSGGTGVVGLIVKGAASQSANLLEIQRADNIVAFRVRNNGNFGSGGLLTGTNAYINNDIIGDTKGLIVRGASGQTADLLQIQNNSGGTVTAIDSTGQIMAYNGVRSNSVTNTTTFNNSRIQISNTGTIIDTGIFTNPALRVQNTNSTATANLTEWLSSAGGTVVRVDASGNLETTGIGITRGDHRVGTGAYYSAALNVLARSTTEKGVVVRGQASQSANLQEWQTSSGSTAALISSAGTLRLTNITDTASTGSFFRFNAANLQVDTRTSTNTGLIISGVASQTGDLQTWTNAGAGTVFARVSASGQIASGGTAVAGPSFLGQITAIPASTATVGIVAQALVNQSARMLEIRDDTGSTYASITRFGTTSLGGDVMSGGRLMVQAGGSLVGLQVRDGGNNAGIQEWQNSGGTVISRIFSSGAFTTGGTATLGQVTVLPASTATVGVVVQGLSGQSANLQNWNIDGGTIRASVDASGNVRGNSVRTLSDYTSLLEAQAGGYVRLTRATATIANPGANLGNLYFVAGTNANTLKLVVRAGAAGAETTILDNIPT